MAKNRAIIVDDDVVVSVLRDNDGFILSGLTIGDTTIQNQQALLLTGRGELKAEPMVGVGVSSSILDDDRDALVADICAQFRADGMTVTAVVADNGIIKTKAKYGDNSFR